MEEDDIREAEPGSKALFHMIFRGGVNFSERLKSQLKVSAVAGWGLWGERLRHHPPRGRQRGLAKSAAPDFRPGDLFQSVRGYPRVLFSTK